MKKEINGKIYELVLIDDPTTKDDMCSGCIAKNDSLLCHLMGRECVTWNGCDKVWKEVHNDEISDIPIK